MMYTSIHFACPSAPHCQPLTGCTKIVCFFSNRISTYFKEIFDYRPEGFTGQTQKRPDISRSRHKGEAQSNHKRNKQNNATVVSACSLSKPLRRTLHSSPFSSSMRGNDTKNVEPTPSSDSNHTCPPCRSTNSRHK